MITFPSQPTASLQNVPGLRFSIAALIPETDRLKYLTRAGAMCRSYGAVSVRISRTN